MERRVISFYGERSTKKKTNGLSAVETVKSERRVSNQITIWIVEDLVIFRKKNYQCSQEKLPVFTEKMQRTIRNLNKNGNSEKNI